MKNKLIYHQLVKNLPGQKIIKEAEALLDTLGNCSRHHFRLLLQAQFYLPHPWGRTSCILAVVSLWHSALTSMDDVQDAQMPQ